MSNTGYGGHGVEIEDDTVRLRRRKLEYEGDIARLAHPTEPRRFRAFVRRGQFPLATTDGRGSVKCSR